MKYRRGEERQGIDRERDIAARQRRDDSADRGAQREHRRPGRARQRVGRHQLVIGGDVGDGCGAGRLEEGRGADRQRHHHVRDPDVFGAADEQQADDEQSADDVGRDHQPSSIDPVDDDAGHRADQRGGQKLNDQHPRHHRRGAGEVENQRKHRDRVEPVAQLRDRLPDIEESEVAVPSKQRQVGIHAQL